MSLESQTINGKFVRSEGSRRDAKQRRVKHSRQQGFSPFSASYSHMRIMNSKLSEAQKRNPM
ncbi:hypothetical protein Psch_02733 [Pelotomaculum schinkii]|uniref:Uncharacterized protein n=1 Tax=Pelotomaculum schinkii TaxID=78350 RepID=A0A4Y7RA79_9FIRM|nr:hypothetical protein Psch_02733 [Pelotomaculum schinkii]